MLIAHVEVKLPWGLTHSTHTEFDTIEAFDAFYTQLCTLIQELAPDCELPNTVRYTIVEFATPNEVLSSIREDW